MGWQNGENVTNRRRRRQPQETTSNKARLSNHAQEGVGVQTGWLG